MSIHDLAFQTFYVDRRCVGCTVVFCDRAERAREIFVPLTKPALMLKNTRSSYVYSPGHGNAKRHGTFMVPTVVGSV